MRVATLPSPGMLSNGIRIRIEAAKAISAVEINAGIPANGGKARNAADLKAFFETCAARIASFVDVTVPTVLSRAISPSNPKRIVLTMSEGLEAMHTPDVTAFTVTGQVKTMHKVTIDGPFVYLDFASDFASDFVAGAVSVAYMLPVAASKRLQDESGNLVASFTAAAVTNGIA